MDIALTAQSTATAFDLLEGMRRQHPRKAAEQADIDHELQQLGIDPRSDAALAIVVIYSGMSTGKANLAPMRDFAASLDELASSARAALAYPRGVTANDIPKIGQQMFLERHSAEVRELLARVDALATAAKTELAIVEQSSDGKIDLGLRRVFDSIATLAPGWDYRHVAAVLCYWSIAGWSVSFRTARENCRSRFNAWKSA